ncbi:DNA alkylation repair protein [Enterococcus saccharolyticus]|uniref:DNA alkylation repair protein n=1 Tax=Enterococcus saccharolyticus TaxID=41997 RepID=UPI003AF14614|nr:DNA alkylation repair protein [Enterococcus saccharolyticus]
MTFEVIFNSFQEAADEERAEKMAAYMRNQFSFLGVATPKRKALTKDFYRQVKGQTIDWAFVDACWACPYRELQYVAIGYLQQLKKNLVPDDIPRLQKIAQTKSWWDTIDGLDKLVGEIAFRYPEVKPILLEWSVSDDFWLRRIAIDHQLLRKSETDTTLLANILVNNLNQTEFFINKAIGWSLRDYSKTNPEWVREFIRTYENQMAPLSIREASKYI